jgi:hypothetical protein
MVMTGYTKQSLPQKQPDAFIKPEQAMKQQQLG